MGIYINHSLKAECSDADLLARLKRLRKRFLKMPLAKVGRIERLDPVYNRMCIDQLDQSGFVLPKPIRARLKGKRSTRHAVNCHLIGNVEWMNAPKKLLKRYYKPADDFIKTTKLWKEDELPEKSDHGSWTFFRKAFSYELASVMIRHGYLMAIDPGEGCDTVCLGLSTMGGSDAPLWLGWGGTKTQYAVNFLEAHENVCRIIDCVQEEGLLMQASDTCEFYNHRDWKKAAPIVNAETTFAHVVKGVLSAVVDAANQLGAGIRDISDPATKNYNLVHVAEEEENGK